MNVRWMRTATIGKGGFMEAISWAKETSAYVEKKTGVKVEMWVDGFGPLGTVRWTMEFADLAGVEKAQMLIQMDPGYHQMVQKATNAELFMLGTVVDTVSRKV